MVTLPLRFLRRLTGVLDLEPRALAIETGDLFPPIRQKDDLSPYVSGSPGMDDQDYVTHEVREMLAWVEHNGDKVTWAIRTKEGRIIIVMQQRHDAYRDRVGGQVELTNSPFPSTATLSLAEHEAVMDHVRFIVSNVRGL